MSWTVKGPAVMDDPFHGEATAPSEPPITGFLAGWWVFIKGYQVRKRGGPTQVGGPLHRMSISEDEAKVYSLADFLGSTALGIVFLVGWDDWMKDHDIRLGMRAFHEPGNWKGALAMVALAVGCHLVVTYFLAMFWYFTQDA